MVMDLEKLDLDTRSGNNSAPFVAIWMVTYNHNAFIEQAIESVMIQATDFEYKLFVGEDSSTDNTREICKKLKEKYPKKIELFLNEKNLGGILNAIQIYKQCFESGAKYVALLEGDDYWTDPLKLQKQVDFFEANEEYSICWTKYKTLNQANNNYVLDEPEWIDGVAPDKNFNIDLDNVFTPYCTYTLTCMFRKESLNFDFFKKMQYIKDNTLYALCLKNGKGVLLDFYSAVYRFHSGGVYSNATVFSQKYFSYLNIKEIITLPECNNNNIRTVRNYLLIDSLIHLSRKNIFKYIILFWDSFTCFGIKKTITIFLKKIKDEPLARKSIG